MSLEITRLDELLARIGYRRGIGKGNPEEVWVVYPSRVMKANHECLIGTVNDILKLTDYAIKQLVEEETDKLDRKIIPDIKPL